MDYWVNNWKVRINGIYGDPTPTNQTLRTEEGQSMAKEINVGVFYRGALLVCCRSFTVVKCIGSDVVGAKRSVNHRWM